MANTRFPELRNMRMGVRFRVREVHVVTKWKDDCVYRTKSLGLIVCNPDYQLLIPAGRERNYMIGSASTSVTKDLM